jgi:cyclic pyranopterin phosphate synthase
MSNDKLTHINEEGLAYMVDVSNKKITSRKAVASGRIIMKQTTLEKVYNNEMSKGNVLAVAQVAGIQAVKETSRLIPMAHNINILGADIKFNRLEEGIEVICSASCEYTTGIEMEVIVGASIALATIYDMTKAVDKDMVITDIMLLEKTGGKSGDYKRFK